MRALQVTLYASLTLARTAAARRVLAEAQAILATARR